MPYALLRKGTRLPRKLKPSARAACGTSGPNLAWSTSSAAKHELLTSSSRTLRILRSARPCVKVSRGGLWCNGEGSEPCCTSLTTRGVPISIAVTDPLHALSLARTALSDPDALPSYIDFDLDLSMAGESADPA